MKKLYQTIEKEHMEWMTRKKIDDEEWNAFCDYFIDAFAEEVSRLAKDYWNERSMYMEGEQ